MKLLLTSEGLTNRTISDSLFKLVGKMPEETSIVYVPTATENIKDKWLNHDLKNIRKLNVKSLEVIDISTSPIDVWIKKFEAADVLFFGGGDTFRLMYWMDKSGLKEIIQSLLKSKVYVGISAGSCVASDSVTNSVQDLFDEPYRLKIDDGLNFVNFQIVPHLNSPYFGKIREEHIREEARKMSEPVYAIDDQCAVEVNNDTVSVIGNGKHFEFNV